MTFAIEELEDLAGFTVEWAEPDNYVLSQRNEIFRSADLKPPFEKISAVRTPAWKRALSRSRAGQRFLRFMVTNVLPLKNGERFVTFDKTVGIERDGEFRALKGLIRPCRVLRSACAEDNGGNVFFGEYLANDDRGVMRVYKYAPGEDYLSVLHEFPAGSIKHIHGLYFDEFSGYLYCLTGDDDHECRIVRTNDEFATTEIVGSGDETWRAVSMIFTEQAIYYGMDAEYRKNQIFRLDRTTFERTVIGEVSGTVFYSKRMGDDLFFTTTAENAPAQTENVAAIWHVDADGRLDEMIKFKKDRWHPTLFQFGTIHFPNGPGTGDELLFHLVGVEGDNRSFRIYRTS